MQSMYSLDRLEAISMNRIKLISLVLLTSIYIFPAFVCAETGSLKRSGGQGDVLCGIMATFVGWNMQTDKEKMQDKELIDVLSKSAFAATCVLRWCAEVRLFHNILISTQIYITSVYLFRLFIIYYILI